jgi:hypothetical protein
MTKEQLAEKLNGVQYGDETNMDVEREARESGLVIVFGASDDLVEFRGAINDEGSGLNPVLVDRLGLLPDRDQIEDDTELESLFARWKFARRIEPLWCEEPGYSWAYRTDIPHATFLVASWRSG